ncbi:NlpC/P60 family protein [Aurantiacibacter flavus]|uniref:NlpC/P60 family protein n=1 Tax=Aurantiacibacter flavus TaxID=3145232 RepID=A0ABV0CXD6_9SPHN
MADGSQLLAAAHALVGAPFRLGGMSREQGIDCVGLVVLALRALGRDAGPLPPYRLRQTTLAGFAPALAHSGLRDVADAIQPGDVLALRPSPSQLHLAIAGEGGALVHAHAGLRRVVHGPRPAEWPLLRSWRLAPSGD